MMNRAAILLVIGVLCAVCLTLAAGKPTSKNHDLLQKIGFARVRAPNSHHRKRLAVESRHHSRSDDSHMFVIKLPPNQHYYVHNRPNHVEPDKKVPVGFKSNGKPGKIYHWNIPVIKKIVQAKSKSRLNDDSNQIDIKYYANWNEVLDKQHEQQHHVDAGVHSVSNLKNAQHKAAVSAASKLAGYKKPSYYVPATVKKSSFLKYFPGNGKPQSFYVIEKNKKKHHHKLLN